jgi:nitrile hydratase
LRAGEHQFVADGVVSGDDLARWRDVFDHDPRAVPPVASNPELVALVNGLGPARIDATDDAPLAAGDRVRVRRMRPPRHHRCPRYLRGAAGSIERVVGTDLVPGLPPGERAVETLYTVEFSSAELFGADGDGARDTVLIDLFERYLEPAG